MVVVRGRVQALQEGAVVVAQVGLLREVAVADVGGAEVGDLVEVDPSGAVHVLARRERGLGAAERRDVSDAARWSLPVAGRTRAERLLQRQTVVRALRDHLYEEGFLEVPGPVVLRGVTPEAHIDPFEVDLGSEGVGYLTTSTEYQIKRMLVGGFERLFTLGPNFRRGELGPRHNPEFTMLEWARAYVGLEAIEADCEALVRRAFHALEPASETIEANGSRVRLVGEPWERVSVRAALALYLGVHVDVAFSRESLLAAVEGLELGASPLLAQDRLGLASLLVDRLASHLGHRVPTFLVDWPAFMTVSAASQSAPVEGLAARSELFVAGLELSDGFPALRGAERQARALEAENASRSRPVRLDERYLGALAEGMPPAAGMALGVDRLVLLLTGAPDIGSVLPFAWDEV